MKMKNEINRTKVLLVVFVLIGVALLAVGASFAIFTYNQKGDKTNTITAGDLFFTYTEDETVGNGITISNGLPTSDELGKESSEYFDFTISSTTGQSVPINYEVVAEKQDTSTFSVNHIKMYLTEVNGSTETPSSLSLNEDGSVKTVGEYNNTEIVGAKGKTIYTEDILGNTKNYEKHFRLRMWISDTATSTVKGKWAYSGQTFSVKVNVYTNPTRKELAMMKQYITLDENGDPILDDKNNYIPINEDFRSDDYREKITKVAFSNQISMPSSVIASWDVSEEANSGKVMAWLIDDGKGTGTYSLTIAGNNDVGSANLSYLFQNFTSLEEIDTTHLNTSNTKEMRMMFYNCTVLTSLDLSNFDTSNVTDMRYMFYGCTNLASLKINSFDTSNVTGMKYMFKECSALTSLDISTFDTSKVTTMQSMFLKCSSLTSLDVSNFDTSNVTDMSHMFMECSALTSLDLSTFDTSKVTTMQLMFYQCSGLTSLDVSSFDTSKVTTMQQMFFQCSGLTSLDLSNFDTSKVTTMQLMFYQCSSLISLDVSNFNTSNVTSMRYMFGGCSVLINLDVSNFDTSNVTDMAGMFSKCSALISLALSNFDTSNVADMNSIFNECSSLTSLDVSNFDTSNVTSMRYMFSGCSSLISLDTSNFDISNVTDMSYMFYKCSSLTKLDFRNATFTTETKHDFMFLYVPSTITVIVKDTAAQTFIQNALGSGNGTVTIA